MIETVTRRAASLAPTSWDPATRTLDVVFATEAPVRRRDYGGAFDEVLTISADAVDLARLNAGASVLDSHADARLSNVLGSVVPGSARIEGRKAVATVRLSDRPEVAGITADIAAGTIGSVSVGYRIEKAERTEAAPGGVAVVRATRWSPVEISFVPVPADPAARTRNLFQEPQMSTQTTASEQAPQTRAFGDTERRALVTRARIPDPDAFLTAQAGTDEAAFRSAVLDALVDEQERQGGPQRGAHQIAAPDTIRADGRIVVGRSHDGPDAIARAVEDALFSRMSGKAPEGKAREFAARSILEMGEAVLRSQGRSPSWLSRSALADAMMTRSGGMHATSDFPQLLLGAGRRVLLDRYAAAASPLKAISRARTAADFRAISVLRLSEMPALDQVAEHGEIRRGSRSEAVEAFSVSTFAKIFAISRNALINDDLGAFADSAAAWGTAAANVEADALAALLNAASGAGPTLSDGQPLFHATHGNLGAPGSISISTISAARQQLRTTTGLDGKTILNLAPRFLVVPAALETAGEQFVATLYPAKTADVVPEAIQRMELIVEPRLASPSAWYVFADPGAAEVISHASLAGQEGPQVSVQQGWDVLGQEFRVVMDFGCGVTGFRGAHRNPNS